MRISLVAAMSQNGVIGKDNALPWHIPEELKYFRKITQGKPIIMGRKTFESMNSKPLPQRHNIIITHTKNLLIDGVTVVHSVEEALKASEPTDEVMVIGGASVYSLFLPFASRIYLTIIHENYEGDTFFPTLEWEKWQTISEENKGAFTVKIFDKNPC